MDDVSGCDVGWRAAIVTIRTISTSPRYFARIASVFCLFVIISGMIAEMFVLQRVSVRGLGGDGDCRVAAP